MPSTTINPLKTGLTRVYLLEGRARPDHVPNYQGTLRMGALSQGFGDIEKIEVPDPDNYGKYLEVGITRGQIDRVTTTLEGRYALSLKSELARLAIKGCSLDVQLHMGQCKDPRNFLDFDKNVILEDVLITSFSTEDLGSLSSGDEAPVNEMVDISARRFYEVMQMTFGRRADALITNEVTDVVICGGISCNDCSEENDGCDVIFAVTKAAGGSPSTPPDILFSRNKGVDWLAHDVDTLSSTEDATGIACLGAYVMIISATANSISYVEASELKANSDPAFTEITTGFVALALPRAIKVANNTAFIVGDLGYIYTTTDPTAGVTVADAGVAVIDKLLAVDALSDTFAVAVGQNGAIVVTYDGATWAAVVPRPVGAGIHLNTVAVKSTREWLIGTSDGRMFYTNNAGLTWTSKTFSGSGTGQVRSIVFATDSIVYMAHSTTAPAGRIFRSYDGGHAWTILPEGDQLLPANDYVGKLAACKYDPNFVVGAGLADDAADGYLVVGSA